MIIDAKQKRPLGLVGRFGVFADESATGLLVGVGAAGLYATHTDAGYVYAEVFSPSEPRPFGEAFRSAPTVTGLHFATKLEHAATGKFEAGRGWFEKVRGEPFLYDLECAGVQEAFARACALGEALQQSKMLKLIHGEGGQRSAEHMSCEPGVLPTLNTNISLWGARSASQDLAFLPDAVLLGQGSRRRVLSFADMELEYEVLQVTAHPGSFPPDTQQVGTEVRGGQALPVIRLGELTASYRGQVAFQFQLSSLSCAERARDALEGLLRLARLGAPAPASAKADVDPERDRRDATTVPAGPLTLSSGTATSQLALLVGQGANRRELFLFAGDRLRLGRQRPKPGDADANDLVVRAPAPPGVEGTDRDPNLRISRRHLDLVRQGNELAVLPLGSCETHLNGSAVAKGARAAVQDTFRLSLGGGVITWAGQVYRAADAAQATLAGVPPAQVPSGAELGQPLLGVRLLNEAAGPRIDLVLRQLAIGTAEECSVQVKGAGIAPVHARVLNLRGRLYLQPVIRAGIETRVGGRPTGDPSVLLPLLPGMCLRVGALEIWTAAIEDGMRAVG